MYRRLSSPRHRFCLSAGAIARIAGATRHRFAFFVVALLFAMHTRAGAEPTPAATAAFNHYVAGVEAKLARQHSTQRGLLTQLSGQDRERLRRGEVVIEKVSPEPSPDLPGAMLHDWLGTAFVPGAKAADFDGLMRNFAAYPRVYSPQVLQAKVLAQQGDHYQILMRVRQKHVITVVLDTTYDINFGRRDAQRGYSGSRSTQVAEIDSAGTDHEHVLPAGKEHGFLWRLNTYWSYEEGDGGLYMQIETVSLTRSIPTGLGWVIGPFVESVPRDSLEFTLRSTCSALRK